MAEKDTSAEYNPDENFGFEGYSNEDKGDNELMVLYSYPDSSHIEISLVQSSEVSSDHIDFGDEKGDNGPNIINGASVTANENLPNWTTIFTGIKI